MAHQYVCKDVSVSDSTQVVSFKLSEVPEYLHKTAFYSSLEDDGEEITLPTQFFKKDFNILTPADACDLLSTMRFWGVEKVPSQLIMYVAKSSHQDLNDMLSRFTQELRVVEFLRLLNLELHHIRASTYDEYLNWRDLKRAKTVLESLVSILALQFQHERGHIWNERTTALVATMGWLDCLTFLHEFGCPWDESTCANAAGNNHMDCLKYAHTHDCPWDAQTTGQALRNLHTGCFKYARDNGCPGDEATCSAAARFGELQFLKFAHENGCPWDETTCEAGARANSLACLQYAHEQGCPWDASTCTAAACAGNLMVLKYAHEQGCPWDESTCRSAARNGYLACLQYAHEQGCSWDASTCIVAARNQSSACLTYAHKHGCSWSEEVVKEAAFYSSIECLRYALNNDCPGRGIACESVGRRLDCLKYLREVQKCPWHTRIVDTFVRNPYTDTECITYCLAQGCHVDEDTMLLAVHNLDKIKLLHKHGCPWDKRTLHAIVEAGDLEKLKYCLENGCPGREDVVLAAARFPSLLKYLHAQGCPLLPEAYQCALQAVRPIECVRFLFETGCCPWPKDACTWFVQHRRMDCLKYAHMHGAPWDADTCAAAAHIEYGSSIASAKEEQRRTLDFLAYLHEEGCPWNVLILTEARRCGNIPCLQYAFQRDCPNTFVCQGVQYSLKLEVGTNGITSKIERVNIASAALTTGVGEKGNSVNESDVRARSNQALVGASVGKNKKTRKNFSKRQRRERRRQQARRRHRRAK